MNVFDCVTFFQLHINDISKYADVYNQNSDGGAFKNIKVRYYCDFWIWDLGRYVAGAKFWLSSRRKGVAQRG